MPTMIVATVNGEEITPSKVGGSDIPRRQDVGGYECERGLSKAVPHLFFSLPKTVVRDMWHEVKFVVG